MQYSPLAPRFFFFSLDLRQTQQERPRFHVDPSSAGYLACLSFGYKLIPHLPASAEQPGAPRAHQFIYSKKQNSVCPMAGGTVVSSLAHPANGKRQRSSSRQLHPITISQGTRGQPLATALCVRMPACFLFPPHPAYFPGACQGNFFVLQTVGTQRDSIKP